MLYKENVNSCGFLSKSRLLNMDSIEYLQVAKPGIDIAFLDPPYNNDIIQKALPLLDKKNERRRNCCVRA